MLINDAYPLSDSFQPEISYYKDTDVQMNSCIQDAYAAMSATVREQFDVPLYVREAYRTEEEQEEEQDGSTFAKESVSYDADITEDVKQRAEVIKTTNAKRAALKKMKPNVE